jgi:hypothetical protein
MVDGRITISDSKIHAPGVWFGLPDEEYHAALGLSASGIKRLRVSALAWWTDSALNPDRVEAETDAKAIGKAFHARIIEGRKVFLDRYAPKLDPRYYGEVLRTNLDLAEAIGRFGQKPKSRLKADLIKQLSDLDPQWRVHVWDVIEGDYAALHRGKLLLDLPLMAQIENAAAAIESHPQLCRAFRDGMPEVSIFWTDPVTGVPCKARLDYLKPRAIVDLKTFELRDTPPNRAIARAVAAYRYHIQASWYLRAVEQIPALVAAGQVSGHHDPVILNQICDATEKTFLFVFQAKGLAPIVKGKVLGPGIVLDLGHVACEEALVWWARGWSTWGSNSWAEVHDVETFADSEFPPWIAD